MFPKPCAPGHSQHLTVLAGAVCITEFTVSDSISAPRRAVASLGTQKLPQNLTSLRNVSCWLFRNLIVSLLMTSRQN